MGFFVCEKEERKKENKNNNILIQNINKANNVFPL